MSMEVVKGTIKILENKIILKTNNTTETYIKKFSITNKNWIEFKGDIYEIESGLEEDYEFDN